VWLFPVSFISSAFVGAGTMPGPLKAVAEWNPFTAVIQSVRDLFGNEAPPGMAPPQGWPAEHALLYAVLTSVAVLLVFVPLSVAKYRRVASR
jgi:ABC-type polysaccharide/polyol phosphate export permease